MGEEKLLGLRFSSRLLDPSSRHQFFTTHNLVASPITRDNQGLARCHHYCEMIHTFPNPVNLFSMQIKTGVLNRGNDSDYRFMAM